MHSFQGRYGLTKINYNSDLSQVLVHVKRDKLEDSVTETYVWVELDGELILDFVAEYIKRRKIEEIEQMNTKEILGFAYGEYE